MQCNWWSSQGGQSAERSLDGVCPQICKIWSCMGEWHSLFYFVFSLEKLGYKIVECLTSPKLCYAICFQVLHCGALYNVCKMTWKVIKMLIIFLTTPLLKHLWLKMQFQQDLVESIESLIIVYDAFKGPQDCTVKWHL